MMTIDGTTLLGRVYPKRSGAYIRWTGRPGRSPPPSNGRIPQQPRRPIGLSGGLGSSGRETSTSDPVETGTIPEAMCLSSTGILWRIGCPRWEPGTDRRIHEAGPSSHTGTRDNANASAIPDGQTHRTGCLQIHDPRSVHRDIEDTIPAWAKESHDPALQSP